MKTIQSQLSQRTKSKVNCLMEFQYYTPKNYYYHTQHHRIKQR